MKYQYTREELEHIEQSKWLTDRERYVFDRYYIRGWHIEEIAAELDTCRNTINNILKSIRQKSE